MLTMKPNIYVKKGALKTATLQAIDRGIDNSRMIFMSMDYPNYDTFQKNLYNLWKRNYVKKSGSKPHKYSLTSKGKQHADNPFLNQERKAMIFSKKLESIMKDSEQYQQILIRMASEDIQNKNRNGLPSAPVVLPVDKSGVDFGNDKIEDKDKIDNKDEIDKDKIVDRLLKQVRQLKYENSELHEENQRTHQNYEALRESGKVKKKVDINSQTANKRKALAEECMKRFNGQIDEYFLDNWGYTCILLSSGSMLNKNYVDIVSKSYKGDVVRKLTAKEIQKKNIRITKYDKAGITINAKCLQKPKYLKFDRFDKIAPKQVRPQSKPTQTHRPAVSIRASKRI